MIGVKHTSGCEVDTDSLLWPIHVKLQALLVDRSDFRAAVLVNGVLIKHVRGKLTDSGSRDFLAKFLLGGPADLGGFDEHQVVVAKTPRVTELELTVTRALDFLQRKKEKLPFDVSDVRFLGMGATGVVLETLRRTECDGSDGPHTRNSVRHAHSWAVCLFVIERQH